MLRINGKYLKGEKEIKFSVLVTAHESRTRDIKIQRLAHSCSLLMTVLTALIPFKSIQSMRYLIHLAVMKENVLTFLILNAAPHLMCRQ